MTNHNIVENGISPDLIPQAVIDTALTTTNGNITNMTILLPDNYAYQAVVICYFAELNATASNTSRQFYAQAPEFSTVVFNPLVNASELFSALYETYGPFDYFVGWDITLYQDQTIYSPLGPSVNALEVLEISESVMAILTNREDCELLFCLLSTSFQFLSKFSSEDTPIHSTPRVSFLHLG
jgi:hypothetical protein